MNKAEQSKDRTLILGLLVARTEFESVLQE